MAVTTRWIAASAAGLVLMMSGCSSSTAPDPVGTWGAADNANPQLILSSDGTVTGTDGCNTLNGNWTLEGDTVEFGPFASTRMACPDVDTWLANAVSATIDFDAMHLMDSTGAQLGTLDKQES
ncbi:META domain-containing protein [Demequina oxidasica]|uniref:META domain-containing protein n=1 Tax=Demequina oxidasica TaxID=676199 RepID=UPI0007837D50|nr:META domain-containing protein [Demequina oxidasica]